MADYDSESEDQPRAVLDLGGDFTLHNCKPRIKCKLDVLKALIRQFPPGGVIAARPVANPLSVAHATRVMSGPCISCWKGTVFNAPEDLSPAFIFAQRRINHLSSPPMEDPQRFCIRRRFVPDVTDLKTMAIYTDGACALNGLAGARGGFAFAFNADRVESQALELKGPTGQAQPHTSNRAELRAVIAALRFRVWWGEGWTRIVIITDSEYVGKGATAWLPNWVARGWRTAAGKPVANQDLWEVLSEVMGGFAQNGCEISFWMIPRKWNTRADAAAKDACELKPHEAYATVNGILC